MLLAFLFGAAHALTPGHGKTLVAAYLVGERGTVWHALFLGLVTTLTHTGVVLILAAIMAMLPIDMQRSFQTWIINGLGLVMGLMVVCIGFWLLLQRLAGQADHVHVGGGHHHHGPEPTSVSARHLSWWGLVVLGVTGGMVPCVDAIVLFLYTMGTSRFWLVLPAVLAFSAGLAVVLVLIGVLVVQLPRYLETRGGDGRLMRSLPIVSALLVTLMGLWLCYEGVHGR
jgi:ABC-type nickel/cobalt efflux system permease component RcnA